MGALGGGGKLASCVAGAAASSDLTTGGAASAAFSSDALSEAGSFSFELHVPPANDEVWHAIEYHLLTHTETIARFGPVKVLCARRLAK